jgi:hypothetical protein
MTGKMGPTALFDVMKCPMKTKKHAAPRNPSSAGIRDFIGAVRGYVISKPASKWNLFTKGATWAAHTT